MNGSYCAQCIHYIPHYIKFGENLYDLIRCGHCTFPRKKHRDAYAKPCPHFQKPPEKPVPANTKESCRSILLAFSNSLCYNPNC